MTVMIVDDSRMIRQLLASGLRELGADEVIEVESADKAIRVLRFCGAIDVVITDWHMPGMSGLAFIKMLRADPRFQSTPMIMSTSEAAGENVVAALRAGATNYLIKPFSKAQLAERVGPFLRANRGATISSAAMPGVSQTGVLKPDELADLLQFFVQSRKHGRCELSGDNCHATFYFENGKLIGARAADIFAEEAVFLSFSLALRRYVFHEEIVTVPRGCHIQQSTPYLLLESLAREDARRTAAPQHLTRN